MIYAPGKKQNVLVFPPPGAKCMQYMSTSTEILGSPENLGIKTNFKNVVVGDSIGTCMLQCHVANIFQSYDYFSLFGLRSCSYLLFLNAVKFWLHNKTVNLNDC